MPRPIKALIHPDAVSHNLDVVKQRAPTSRIWAVVKANAYGHGIERIYPALEAADGIAVLDLDEAVRTRQLGWKKPILLLEGIFDEGDVRLAEKLALTSVVHCNDQLRLIASANPTRPIDIFLKMNSGMNRLGFSPKEFKDAWSRASRSPAIANISLMSHFANADNGEVAWQMTRFDEATQNIPGSRSLANSAATLWHKSTHRDWVRPGIVLYGASPSGLASHISDAFLRASMTLTSEIIATQALRPGDTVGYGHTYKADRAIRIGVVACGYADGYPRQAPNGSPIAVNGTMTQTIGRVSMDMLTVDLTPCPQAGVGSKVELWGDQVKVDNVAFASGTIGYELMCALPRRVPVTVITGRPIEK